MVTIQFEDKQRCLSCCEQLKASVGSFENLSKSVDLVTGKNDTQVEVVVHAGEQERNEILTTVAAVMTNFTLKVYLKSWLEDVVRNHFYYQEVNESNEIVALAWDIIADEHPDIQLEDNLSFLQRQLHLLFCEILNETSKFSYESFIQFRLRKLRKGLIEAVEVAIDEYKMEQEYQTMVESCRQYLAQESPKIKAVHVVLSDQPVSIYDHSWNRFTLPEILRMLDDRVAFDGTLPVSERIISPLVSMAPRKVFLHDSKEVEEGPVVRTLLAIFEERISFC
ncbi:putative sporulation protein YtxC [Alteribacter populi]|uniref:putative sporulation protein YtxC n=1 Tax=Alteribacter populi TaxID=2011011 RepID=UPI0012FE28E1|nr:putative sporulation protein YtxC [Alteribacter populi]